MAKNLCLLILASNIVAFGQAASPSPTPSPSPSPKTELNIELMKATLKLTSTDPASPTLGTGFIIGRPLTKDPTRLRYVLVSAAHVFQSFVGNSMVAFMHQQLPNGKWQDLPIALPIRKEGKPLWVENPAADVAAMYISLPPNFFPQGLVPMSLLGKDEEIEKFEVHPGDELNVLGFPLGFASIAGFPVLRSGKIASYPLVPTKENPYFLLDFRVFEGNSGGPVYMVSSFRIFNNSYNAVTVQMILGLVSAEERVTQQTKSLYEDQVHTYPLGLARIVPASFISETIMMLPSPD